MITKLLESIIKAVEELNEDKVINLVKYHLSIGEEPINIINSIQTGMFKVGELFEARKFFLADLIMAGIIFKEVLNLEEMSILINSKGIFKKKPLLLIGTVKDDLHDIGKDIFSGMARTCGYDIIDLGVDISPETFLKNYYKCKPDIIGISGILTESIKNMKAVVDLFNTTGEREHVKIIVGGNPITKEAFQFIGADAYSLDVKQGIKICDQWINNKNEELN
ncbi:MAG: cobalamin B12-binding domain-containing protein [Eubacteriales bacterium]